MVSHICDPDHAGVTTQNAGLYHGNGLDIPLRQWLRNHDINDGLGEAPPRTQP